MCPNIRTKRDLGEAGKATARRRCDIAETETHANDTNAASVDNLLRHFVVSLEVGGQGVFGGADREQKVAELSLG